MLVKISKKQAALESPWRKRDLVKPVAKPLSKAPQYVTPPGLSKQAAESAKAINTTVAKVLKPITASKSVTGEAEPLSKLSKPVVRFSATPRRLTVNDIIDAYLAWKPAR